MFGPRKKILKFKVSRLLENASKSWIVLLISLCTQCTCTWHLLNLGLVRTLGSRTGCTWHLTKGLSALALDFWRVLHSRSRANVPWSANWVYSINIWPFNFHFQLLNSLIDTSIGFNQGLLLSIFCILSIQNAYTRSHLAYFLIWPRYYRKGLLAS